MAAQSDIESPAKSGDAAPRAASPFSVLTALRAELPMIVGLAITAVIYAFGHGWTHNISSVPFTTVLFLVLFGVMIWCAFGVVRHAEALAHHFGEPYGTLILTLAVVSIEVTIMATIMLTGDPNPTLPRDTVYAVMMIVLNAMVGISIIAGALRHRQQQYSLQGAVAFLAVITCLAAISLIIPTVTRSTSDHSVTPVQAVVFAVLTAALYGGFLMIQTMRHRTFFIEADAADDGEHAEGSPVYPAWAHATLLLLTLLPVVLLAKPLALIVDFALEELHAPATLGGIIIAILVLSPEGLSSFRAASQNHLQRSVNLSLGSALSTIGLTIPVMLVISLFTGTPLHLGLAPADAVLLGLTLLIAQMTFSGAPTNILLGGVHLVIFAAFVVLIFSP